MSLTSYCAMSMGELASTKRSLTTMICKLSTFSEAPTSLNTLSISHSELSAAMSLKSYGLAPGDVIVYPGSFLIRIEDKSDAGFPIGQPVTADGIAISQPVKLFDYRLCKARKYA